jgi:phosphopantetheine--protein transferase-like protein
MDKEGKKEISIWKCHRKNWDNLISCKNILNHEEQTKHNKLKIIDDKKRFIIGKVISRSVLSKILNIDSTQIEFISNKFGKPYLKYHSDTFFNISHSGDWVVVGFASSDIGVDVQEISNNKRIDFNNIAKHAFHNKELDFIKENTLEQNINFYKIWTLKEAFLKAKGVGFYNDLDKINMMPAITNKNVEIDNFCFYQKKIDNNHIIAVAYSSDNKYITNEQNFTINS